ncbi:SubName: Full=Related to PMU1-high copy suppressor of ts tps2 mutant phenotype {ECO:0000313/EMBL:CCA68671.1} [Serendipita indica DSM 11827]|nr:SubName: Full=Related to PMU1-high copy suppressor of ts tps2 mutant phenotype {ECO:0000313/EMBL:CCA68671.1} [Serendipita indica DSM 11827]
MSIIIPQYDYEVVTGWFIQDAPGDVVELPKSFGLIDTSDDGWTKIKQFLYKVNIEDREPGTIHKLFFLGRHGQGWHNVAETKYGTAEWDRHWSKLNGDGELQADEINAMWIEETKRGIPTPDVLYMSPLRRAIHTGVLSFDGWFYPNNTDPGMEASNAVARLVLEADFPFLLFENGFVEVDPTWTADHRETPDEQDVRSRRALDKMFTADGTYISVSSHSGTMASIFRVIGHRPYAVNPGGVVPVLVRAKQKKKPIV